MMRRGLSLVEVTISMVVISVMLVAGLRLVGSTGSATRFVEDRTVAMELIEAMLADISRQPYEDPDDPPEFGLEETLGDACPAYSWIGFDDVDDYHGLQALAGADRHGPAIVSRPGWEVRVEVAWVKPAEPDVTAAEETGLKRVLVQAGRDGRRVASASILVGREGRDRRAEVPGTVPVLEPLARMLVKPRRGEGTLNFLYSAEFSRDPVGGGLTHRWLFNGVQFSVAESGDHEISTAGVHELTLVVRDGLGRASSTTTFLVVDP
jgi:prepilin-type N-terminal cleavage/methylation domain-containing protein